MKVMLFVSLRDVNCRLDFGLTWDVWGEKSLYLPIQVSLKAVHKEITNIAVTLATQ